MNRVYIWYRRMHCSKCKLYRKAVEYMLRIVFSCDICAETVIGDNCIFAHNALGVVISQNAVIGDNVHIGHNVTIGGRSGNPVVPIIGNNVMIGAGAIILGPIVVGDNAQIGAGAVVVHDVPANETVLSDYAKVLNKHEVCND